MVGFALGEGRSLDDIVSGMHMVAEGVKSAGPLVGLAQAHGVEMPIAEQVQAIVEGRCSPADALHEPHAPPVTAGMGRGPAAGVAGVSGLFHSYDVLPDEDDEARSEAALAHVKEILLMHGATEEEIDQAVADGVIDLFVAERMLVPSRRRYTRAEVAELTGVELDKLERFWRALGFANVDDDDRAFTDLDLEAVRLFQGMQALGATDTDTALQMARVIGSSMARIAEAELVPGNMVSPEVDPVMSADAFASVADETIPAMAKLLEFVWRRQVAAGIQRSMMLRSHGLAPGQSPVLAVGFADMVGFTLLSQHLSDEELAAVVGRFEEISHDIVTSKRGRVVKMIGDEVMFVVESVADAARIGLDLADAYADDDLLSDVRVGLACGPVLLPRRRLLRTHREPGPPDRQHRQPRARCSCRTSSTPRSWRRRRTSSPRSRSGHGCSRISAVCSCGGAAGPARRRSAPAPRPTGAATCAGSASPRSCATSRSCGAWASACSPPTGAPAQPSRSRAVAMPKGRSSNEPSNASSG